jgi:hypothetical protein
MLEITGGLGGLSPSSGILKNTTFRKLYLLLSSVEDVRYSTILDPLEGANPNQRISVLSL